MPLQRVEVRIFTPAWLPPLQARRLQTAFNTTFLARPQVTRWRIAAGDAHSKPFSPVASITQWTRDDDSSDRAGGMTA